MKNKNSDNVWEYYSESPMPPPLDESRASYRCYVTAAIESMPPDYSVDVKAKHAHQLAVKLLELEEKYFKKPA